MLDVPVVLFLFKRKESSLQVLDQVRKCRPNRLYLLSDEGRDESERILVAEVRSAVEAAIDWDCEVIKNYASTNRGVYENIGLGAKWVFERESSAIFLEDDNVPEPTFFDYCQELLDRYAENPKILWVCGTNYLEEYCPEDNASYMFTRHLLPCGWASWADKFNEFYDATLASAEDPKIVRKVRDQHENKALHRQQLHSVLSERKRYCEGQPFISWDYHMAWTIRSNNLFGISPARNQIRNVGADEYATHGGTSLELEMTKRFCGIDSGPLAFPLKHPVAVAVDPVYERKIAKIILVPLPNRIKRNFRRVIGRLLKIDSQVSITATIRQQYSKVLTRET